MSEEHNIYLLLFRYCSKVCLRNLGGLDLADPKNPSQTNFWDKNESFSSKNGDMKKKHEK